MLAVIGGTGFNQLVGLENTTLAEVNIGYGEASVEHGEIDGTKVLFVPRHGRPARFPPHKVNYRANIAALKHQGATHIIGVTAVGTVDEALAVPALVVPDQLIDYTWGRPQTFFDNEIQHIDFTFPYDAELRNQLLSCARSVADEQVDEQKVPLIETGTYGCTQGPRLETAAEIRRMRVDGCSIVGMTAMPEVVLAREIDLPYAGISVTVNPGAGINDQAVELEAIGQAMQIGMDSVAAVIRKLVAQLASVAPS